MSSAEFVYWQAYASLEPFGDARGDLQAAIIAQTIANRHRGAREKAYKLQDFLPNFQARRRMNTPEAQKEFFRAMTLAVGGQVTPRPTA
jgi:hypothetical protein